MWRWLRRLFGTEGKELESQSETQALRLDLDEMKRKLASVTEDLKRQREGENRRVDESAQARIEELFADAAGPVSQLLTQEHLLETGKPVQAKDVIAVSKRLVRTLEDLGLELEGRLGEVVPFDPNLHEPLGSDVSISRGKRVSVRLLGISYRGKVIRKAGVERTEA